jgi:hypothetical protein
MTLDNLEGIREWRDRLDQAEMELVGIKVDTLLNVLDLLQAEIDRLQSVVDTGKTSDGGVKTVPLHKTRRHHHERGTPEEPKPRIVKALKPAVVAADLL